MVVLELLFLLNEAIDVGLCFRFVSRKKKIKQIRCILFLLGRGRSYTAVAAVVAVCVMLAGIVEHCQATMFRIFRQQIKNFQATM